MQSRRAHNIELKGAVVIFDEAHNLVRPPLTCFTLLLVKFPYAAPKYSNFGWKAVLNAMLWVWFEQLRFVLCCRRRPARNPPPSIWHRTRWLQPSVLWTGCCWSRSRPAALHRLKTAAITILVSIFFSFCHWGGTPGLVQNVTLACPAEWLTYFFFLQG